MLRNITDALGNALGVARELVTGYHPPIESKREGVASASSSQVVKALNTNTADKKDDDLIVRETMAVLSNLLPPLQGLTAQYYADGTLLVAEAKNVQPSLCTHFAFVNHAAAINAKTVADNLLWHLDIDNTLEWARRNPECLRTVVEVTDPHGQRVRGTVLQVLLSAGDRNPREMKQGEPDWGLVERLRPCFATMPEEFDRQYQEWDKKREAETKKTHERFDTGMITLLNKIIADDKAISNAVPFEDLLNLDIAQELKAAFTPDPKYVAEGGLLFDYPGMVLRLVDLLNQNEEALGGYGSLKYDLFAAMVFSQLQARVQRCDLEVLSAEKGIDGVVNGTCLPRKIDYSKGLPDDLKDIGVVFIFSTFGRLPRGQGLRHAVALVARLRGLVAGPLLQNLVKQKTSALDYATLERSLTERMSNKVILGSRLAAKTASQ